jgi:hypothetical protein
LLNVVRLTLSLEVRKFSFSAALFPEIGGLALVLSRDKGFRTDLTDTFPVADVFPVVADVLRLLLLPLRSPIAGVPSRTNGCGLI